MNRSLTEHKGKRGTAGLEERLRSLIPVRHVVLTGYARNALYLLVKAMGWDQGAEILIPAFTCSVIPMTIKEAGAVPVPVDAETQGINMDPALLEKSISPRTRAIYVVHTYGVPARIDEICRIAERHGLRVIEDLAQSLFAKYRGLYVGTYGDFAIMSFTKKMINYEGGALTVNDTNLYHRFRDMQRTLQRERRFTMTGLTDQLVRVISSVWESRFSFSVLLVFKLMDLINTVLYRGSYGVSINPERFTMRESAASLTLAQVESCRRKTADGKKLKKFAKGLHDIVSSCVPVAAADGDRPDYFTGIPRRDSALLRFISFRTWHNFNTPGAYPRADYLYDNYRVYSSILLFFPRRRDAQMDARREQECEGCSVSGQ